MGVITHKLIKENIMNKEKIRIYNIRLALGHYIKMTDEEFNSFAPIKVGSTLELGIKHQGKDYILLQQVITLHVEEGFRTVHITSDGIMKNCEYEATVKVQKPGTIMGVKE